MTHKRPQADTAPMERRTRFLIGILGFGLTMTSAATIINTYRLNQLSLRCASLEARPKTADRLDDWPHMKTLFRDANGKLIVHDPGGYDPRTRDGAGLCVHDAIREKVAPGSKGRDLTPEENAAFIRKLEERDRFHGYEKITPRSMQGDSAE